MAVEHPYPGKPLKVGSKGPHVRELQEQLNTLTGKKVDVDGEFGPQTEAKVKAFQENRHLGASGDVDAVIWDRLFGNPPPKLHPRDPESPQAKLRRLREEVPVRQRQIKHAQGERKQALKGRLDKVEKTIDTLIEPKDPDIDGNRIEGGNPRERIVAAALAASRADAEGRRKSFYSQDGGWTTDYAITGEPHGYRSDCSQWVTSVYKSAGLPDPNGNDYKGGYTGTLATHCRKISRAQLQPGDLVLYGSGPPYHHVELYVGPGEQTIGHGSPPVDGGTINMIGEAHFYTAF